MKFPQKCQLLISRPEKFSKQTSLKFLKNIHSTHLGNE